MVKKALYHTSVGLLLVLVIVSNIEPIKAERRLFYLWQDLTKKPNTEPITVKPEDLILNSHKYHGDCITISGTIIVEFENQRLIGSSYFSHQQENFGLEFDDRHVTYKDARRFSGRHARITGIYDARTWEFALPFHSLISPINYLEGLVEDDEGNLYVAEVGDKTNKCDRTVNYPENYWRSS